MSPNNGSSGACGTLSEVNTVGFDPSMWPLIFANLLTGDAVCETVDCEELCGEEGMVQDTVGKALSGSRMYWDCPTARSSAYMAHLIPYPLRILKSSATDI